MICTKDEGVFARSARSTTAYGPLLRVSGRTLPASIIRIFFFHFQCDLNRDGKITQEEFLKAGLSIAELFELESDD